MKHLFLDSQIWLSLYDFSSDDLEQFRRLNTLINSEVKIYLTGQVCSEISRNRENKILAALDKFKPVNIPIPNLCKGYDEYNEFKKIVEKCKNEHKKILSKIDTDIQNESLHADLVITEIFQKLEIHDASDDLIKKSIARYEIGNPPGKNKSYGDAINWELLLEVVPDKQDLFFVSSDKDFRSVLNENKFNNFLKKEWIKKKNSEIFFYTSLTEFFKSNLKDIELKTENEKIELIKKLSTCGNFSSTHSIIHKLSKHSTWTDDQIIELLKAADSNNQVHWIIEDNDIQTFYKTILISKVEKMFELEELHWILEKIGYKNPLQDNSDETE
ncbi:MAG: PIN domain-containing protein [Methylococcales bacterium]|nr:PIN domain-containing protein [Methylococcales bacterium]